MLKVNYWSIFHTNPAAISNTPAKPCATWVAISVNNRKANVNNRVKPQS